MAALVVMFGCARRRPIETFHLEGSRLTITNTSGADWTGVEVWLNTYYRVTTPSLSRGARLDIPLDTFVAAYGQRFDSRRAQIVDVHLVATQPDGRQVTLKMPFEKGSLADALEGVGGRK